MKRRYIHFLLFTLPLVALLMAACSSASATIIKNLFEVGVPILSQSAKERKEASKQAFAILLVRITGRQDLPQSEVGQALIKNARSYVSSFRYELIKEPEYIGIEKAANAALSTDAGQNEQVLENDTRATELEPAPELEPKPTQKLVVSFDEKAVKNSLWKQKLPVWGKTRPSTLLWVAVQDSNQRELLDANEPTALLSYIEKQAEKRGIPMLYPLLDLEDQMNINVTDVWGAFKEPVEKASERYQPEAILSARLFLDPFGFWQSRWTLHQGNDQIDWQASGSDLETVAIEGLNQLADRLALRYAHVSSVEDDSEFLISITDVNSLTDFVRVDKYLSGLSSIKRAELAQIKGSELVFRLDLRSNAKALTQAIKLGKVLLSSEDMFALETEKPERQVYRLMP